MESVHTIVELLAALVAAGGGLFGLAFGLVRLRRSRGAAAELLIDLLGELVGNRRAITSWWRGELTSSWFQPTSLPALASALRNDVLRTRTPREWHVALKDADVEQRLASLADDFARVKRGEQLIASDWEWRLDDAAARVRRRLARRRRLDVLVGVLYRLPSLPATSPSAPRSPAELQRRALAKLTAEDVPA